MKKLCTIFFRLSEQWVFAIYESGFHTIDKYVDTAVLKRAKRYHGGNIIKFERPQLRLKDGKPTYLYVVSDHNIYGGESTIIYVLKLIKKLTHEKPTQSA